MTDPTCDAKTPPHFQFDALCTLPPGHDEGPNPTDHQHERTGMTWASDKIGRTVLATFTRGTGLFVVASDGPALTADDLTCQVTGPGIPKGAVIAGVTSPWSGWLSREHRQHGDTVRTHMRILPKPAFSCRPAPMVEPAVSEPELEDELLARPDLLAAAADVAYFGWTVIANANGCLNNGGPLGSSTIDQLASLGPDPDGDPQNPGDWGRAAVRFRDEFHALLDQLRTHAPEVLDTEDMHPGLTNIVDDLANDEVARRARLARDPSAMLHEQMVDRLDEQLTDHPFFFGGVAVTDTKANITLVDDGEVALERLEPRGYRLTVKVDEGSSVSHDLSEQDWILLVKTNPPRRTTVEVVAEHPNLLATMAERLDPSTAEVRTDPTIPTSDVYIVGGASVVPTAADLLADAIADELTACIGAYQGSPTDARTDAIALLERMGIAGARPR